MDDALVLRSLRKGFQTRTGRVEAVRDVSLSLQAGRVLAFLGPNGAGKTTTIKMAAGLVWPDAGEVLVAGRSLYRHHDWATRRVGAVLEGSRNLYWRLTVMENLVYWGAMRRMSRTDARRRAEMLLERVGLLSRARNTVQTLSRGMQQKVALCQALMHEPEVLLLDEPTLGLDYESGESIKDLVRQLAAAGTAILLTTHQLDVAEALADEVAIVREGRVALSGPTRDLLVRFSRPAATVRAAAPWPPDLMGRLEGAPVTVTGEDTLEVRLRGPEDPVVYDVLRRLEPLPLLEVERHQADLAEVFREVLGVPS